MGLSSERGQIAHRCIKICAHGIPKFTANKSGIAELKSFVAGIERDYDAVKAALRLPWSQGATEGKVNKLKTIKRVMYGRAGFRLLRQRLLLDA